ncbi:uncharacterized protein [Littorina saxatilis]|uniref:uncharacterized protein n=1 Tax=Littorina saxatilis TaxID=31220 RepID=UPI0038B4AB95
MAAPQPQEAGDDDRYFEEYKEQMPTGWNNMFGSLFGVAKAPPEVRQSLTENWYKIIRRWYPGLHQNVYSAPPVHFKAVAYKPKPEKPVILEEPFERFGMRMYIPTQYSTTKDDEAQQRVLWTLSEYAKKKGTAAFILSNMEFQNYLNKDYSLADPNTPEFTKPNIPQEEGEVDVLVIDKEQGVFVLEVKAIGDPEEERNIEKSKQITELYQKISKIGKQVQKEKDVIRKLLSDLDPNEKIKIRAGVVLANTARDLLDETLTTHAPAHEFLAALGILNSDSQSDLISKMTLCSDDLPKRNVTAEDKMDKDLYQKVDRVLDALRNIEGPSETMSDELYEKLVARFCGPLTTVKIYTEKTYPRVKLEVTTVPPKHNNNSKNGKAKKVVPKVKMRVVAEEAKTKAGAARIMARRFSELVLLEEQIEILQRNEEFVHLEGPPGTGKTLVLLLRILTWLDDGHIVWLLSLSPPSRSVTHVLLEQVKRMVRQYHPTDHEEVLQRLRLFMLIRPEKTLDAGYFERRMLKFRLRAKTTVSHPYVGYPRPPTLPPVAAPHDRKVCMALDESGMNGKGLDKFFEQVAKSHKEEQFRSGDFDKGLSVWSASVERVGRPMYLAEPGKTNTDKFGVLWDLTLPLRCPPTVQRALMLVQPSLDQENVCCFQENAILSHPAKQGGCTNRVQYAADGLPVFLIAHGDHKKPKEDIWFCFECGDMLADYLQNELRIGQEECDCPGETICYDEEVPEKCSKCEKLTKGTLPIGDLPLKYNDIMIVATQCAFQFSVPIGGFVHAMAKKKLKVAVNTSREDGDAPIPPDDVILIVDLTSVHGLERAVIIIIPEVKPPPPLPRSLLLNPLYEDKLPPNVRDLIEMRQAEGKDDIILTADGKEEEDLSDDQESLPESVDPAFVKHDPNIKESMEAGEDLVMTGDGKHLVEEEVEGDRVRVADGEMKEAGSSSEGSQRPAPEEEDVEMKDISGLAEQAGRPQASPPTPDQASEQNKSKASSFKEEPFRYTDTHSKKQIQAAIDSMSLQSRQDMFYIGSRAVCQLILVHPGKDPEKKKKKKAAEPMQTDCN